MLRTVIRSLSRPLAESRAPLTASVWTGSGRGIVAPLRRRAGYASVAIENLDSGNKLKLRSYQLDCIKSVVNALKRGHKRVGISLATGSGKTVSSSSYVHLISHPGITHRLTTNPNQKGHLHSAH